MKFSYFRIYLILLPLALLSIQSHGAELTNEEKEALWQEAYEQLYFHPRHILKIPFKKIKKKKHEGYITSNENHFYTMASHLSALPADLHVGFGTAINFNILGSRPGPLIDQTGKTVEKTRTALFADQSPEVVVAMMSFWRTIWLASTTPMQWLAAIANYKLTEDTTVWEIFDNYKSQGSYAALANLEEFKKKLKKLVDAKLITDFDYRFTAAVLEYQILKSKKLYPISLFRYSKHGTCIIDSIKKLYDFRNQFNPSFFGSINYENAHYFQSLGKFETELEAKKRMESLIASNGNEREKSRLKDIFKTSFLFHPDHFHRVRSVFLDQNDFYALTDILNPEFWQEAKNLSDHKDLKLTDVYLSCILEQHDPSLVPSIQTVPGEIKFLYTSTCGSYAPRIYVRSTADMHTPEGENEN